MMQQQLLNIKLCRQILPRVVLDQSLHSMQFQQTNLMLLSDPVADNLIRFAVVFHTDRAAHEYKNSCAESPVNYNYDD